MWKRLLFFIKRLDERLWVRPLLLSLLSVVAALLARGTDELGLASGIPEIAPDSIETLLSITAGSMLVIATLAVASMVSAYASASSTATPRSFPLLIADDLSQNALSTFLGAFIFSFVALVALENDYYGKTGLFVLFSMTAIVVAIVILTFVRWVDRIARLGRIGSTIEKVEAAGAEAFTRRHNSPRLGGARIGEDEPAEGHPVHASTIGYVQHVNVEALQECASQHDLRIRVLALPGIFTAPNRPVAQVLGDEASFDDEIHRRIAAAFDIGTDRVYDDDPRFALIALSEIASRALSPAVNDPGTAISIFGSFVRLFGIFTEADGEDTEDRQTYDRVLVPDLDVEDMLDDAFRAIARDGAGIVEVQIRLQKTLQALASLPHARLAEGARAHSRAAMIRAERALDHDGDIESVATAAAWSA